MAILVKLNALEERVKALEQGMSKKIPNKGNCKVVDQEVS